MISYCYASQSNNPFLCDHLSSHWWLLQTLSFLLPSSFQQEKKHIAFLDGNIPPFLSGHHASGEKRDCPAHPHHTPENSVKGDCAAHTGGSIGARCSPNANNSPILPRFCPTCIAAGLTLRLTCTAYRQRELTIEARGDGLLLV